MKIVKDIARFAVGGLFIFSGLIKVNDPVGTAIKLEEYFQVFAYDFAPLFSWFIPAALFFSVLLSVLEVIIGIALIMGYRMKVTAWTLMVIIVFFTFLTFYSAYFNKVTDCGCFGDAIKLSPWESFIKDIVLLLLSGVVFINRSSYSPLLPALKGDIVVGSSTLVFVIISIYAIRNLPFVDFRTYAVGNDLPALMQPSGELKYAYIMLKDGEEYRLETYPTDNSYQFKSMEILNPEVQPKITDLSIWNDEGEFTDNLLSGKKLLFIVSDAQKARGKNADKLKQLSNQLNNVEVWSLTSSDEDYYKVWANNVGISIPFYYADATVLKTIVRSNPGIVLLDNGLVKGKWHVNNTPSSSEISRLLR